VQDYRVLGGLGRGTVACTSCNSSVGAR